MPTFVSTQLYCDLAGMQNRISATGVSLRVDDNPPTTLGDVLDDASGEIDMYCALHYTPAQLATSRWIYNKACDIATYLLCERRGDPVPVGIAAKFERAMKELERIQAGGLKVADIPQRRLSVPMVSNMRAALRPFPHAVVEKSRGTDTIDQLPKKNIDPWDAMNHLPDFVI